MAHSYTVGRVSTEGAVGEVCQCACERVCESVSMDVYVSVRVQMCEFVYMQPCVNLCMCMH